MKPRQHEPEPSDETADATSRQHAEIHAQLVSFRAREDLIDAKDSIEVVARDPAFFLDQFLTDHRNLRDGPAPRQGAKLQEAEK